MQCLKCWGPRLKWIGYVPMFPLNQFDLVECNTGLQVCRGGCTHCVNITGAFTAKSCAGDRDEGLMILGLHQDGCTKITEAQNKNYTNWLTHMIGKLPNYSVHSNFSVACRCSGDGCNGLTSDKIGVDISASPYLSSSKKAISPSDILTLNLIIMLFIHLILIYYFLI